MSLGNKRQEVRVDVQQKARDVRELEATCEVARLDLKLAQETVQLTQAKFDQGRATLRISSRPVWMRTTSGWLSWTPISRASEAN